MLGQRRQVLRDLALATGLVGALCTGVRAKEPAKMKDQWDIYDALGAVPGPGEDMEVIAPPKDGTCKIG